MQRLIPLPTILGFLYDQYRVYETELDRIRRALSSHHRNIAEIESALVRRQEKPLSRKDKKKLQWSRALAKKSINTMEFHQRWLLVYMRQCNDLIAQYDGHMYSTPYTPWTTTSSSMSDFSPFSAISPTLSWDLAPMTCNDEASGSHTPQYWNVPNQPVVREQSPYAPTVDSGFHEQDTRNQHLEIEQDNDPMNWCPHQRAHPPSDSRELHNVKTVTSSTSLVLSEMDILPELGTSPLPAGDSFQAGNSRKRRYSENAADLIGHRLVIPKSRHQRGNSADAIALFVQPP